MTYREPGDDSADDRPSGNDARAPRSWLADTAAMLGLITRLPLGGGAADDGSARAVRALPVAGAVAGAVGGAALLVTDLTGLPASVAAIAAVAALVLVGGAMHEDGLADVADGFGGGADRAAKLEIMRDSRIGSFGTLALVLAVLARVALIAALVEAAGGGWAALALVGVGALSRMGVVLLMTRLPAARDDGLGTAYGNSPEGTLIQGVLAGLVVGAVAVVPGLGLAGLLAGTAGAMVAAHIVGAMARQQIGGQTGDVCGACQQAGEIAALAGLVISL